jgi:hypothetical protein
LADADRPTKGFLDGRLMPDFVLPAQYYGRLRPAFATGAEGRLLLAVLQDAIDCYVVNMNRRSRHAVIQFREVRDWFNARNHRDLFAFETICEVFGFDPGCIRNVLRTLRDETEGAPPTDRAGGPATRTGAPNVRREAKAYLKRRGWHRGNL